MEPQSLKSSQHTPHTHPIAPSPTKPPHSDILPVVLQSHHIKCTDETRSSAEKLQAQGQLVAEDFIESSPDIERTLMEAFIEDDYEGRLHLITLSVPSSTMGSNRCCSSNGNASYESNRPLHQEESMEVVGLAFWREIPSDEMEEWLDLRRISRTLARHANELYTGEQQRTDDCKGNGDQGGVLSSKSRRKIQMVRSDSVAWIRTALSSRYDDDDNNDDDHNSQQQQQQQSLAKKEITTSVQSTIQKLTHSWIKIELVAIKQSHRAHHLGNVLLGCVLSRAYASSTTIHQNRNQQHPNQHAVLHIAGGGASKNIPAAKLYTRFGFVSIPTHDEGGPFEKPDRDLFVLGNIGKALDELPWDEMLQLSGDGGAGGVDDDSIGVETKRIADVSKA
eukprot:g6160.t1 g6160   contig20:948867-950042(+)